MRLTDPIIRHAKETPHKIALLSDTGTVTYSELISSSGRVANALLSIEKNLAPDDREARKVALLMNNSIEFLQLFIGAAMVGWTAIPFDPKWSPREIALTYQECEPPVWVVDAAHLPKLPASMPRTQVVVLGEPHSATHHDQLVDFTYWTQQQSEQLPTALHVSDADRFYIGYTSGTTGRPKGFVRAHRQWDASFRGTTLEFGITTADVILAPGPFVHSMSLYAVMHALFIGATFRLVEKFEATHILDLIERHAISVIHMVPTMFEALLHANRQRKREWNLQSVTSLISTGAKLHKTTRQNIRHMFPQSALYEYYGASELSYITVCGPEDFRHKPDSVGRAFHGVNLSLRDRASNEVPDGEIGKIFVQSEMLFSGYYKNEAATQQVLQGGWATVGDLGVRDEDGYIRLVGREKNMIISGGLNIYPEEVEHLLLQLPQIDEVAVLGLQDNYWGEKVVAAIKLQSDERLDETAVKCYCRDNLASFKCPREVVFVESFPYTSSGKIARETLKNQLLASATGGNR